jgi:hypothetical protein
MIEMDRSQAMNHAHQQKKNKTASSLIAGRRFDTVDIMRPTDQIE